ncbi:MAG: hypothetical protein J6P74_09470 [Paludibacteraceae bacterium]|nr:hypothetical protein [Paludibacteraceae bacterium]
MNRILRLRIYILMLALSMATVRAVAFNYGHHDNSMPSYAMQSTSSFRGSSMLRASSEVAGIGKVSGHFSTYVPGVGEDITSSSSGHMARPRRVGEDDSSDDPYGNSQVGSIGDLPVAGAMVLALLYCGYIAHREKRKREKKSHKIA